MLMEDDGQRRLDDFHTREAKQIHGCWVFDLGRGITLPGETVGWRMKRSASWTVFYTKGKANTSASGIGR